MPAPLGYALQFTMPFRSRPLMTGGDPMGQLWRVQFYRKGYSGAASELRPGERPWVEETTEADELTGVLAKRVTIGVIAEAVDLLGFYTDSDRAVLVELQQEVSAGNYITRTTAWLNPFDVSEPFRVAPYAIRLTAACGLASLTDYPLYIYPTQRAYADRVTIRELLHNCVSWVGYDLPLRSWTGRYEQSMLVGGTQLPADNYDPLLNVRVNPRRWLKADGSYESCRTVLDDLCRMFGAVLTQKTGVWCFLAQDARTWPQQKWHHYNSPLAANPSLVTEQLDFAAGPGREVAWGEDATLGIVPPKKRLTVKYGYGDPVNLLVNGDFTSAGAGWTVAQNAGQPVTFEGDGTEDSPFRARVGGDQDLTTIYFLNASLRQTVSVTRGSRTVASSTRTGNTYVQSDLHRVRFSGLFVNEAVRGACMIIQLVVAGGKQYMLKQDGTWGPNSTENVLLYDNTWELNNAPVAKPTTGERFEVESDPVPGSGNYTLTVFLFAGNRILPPPVNATRSITYRDVRLSVFDETNLPLDGENWLVSLPGDATDRQRRGELSLVLGDQLSVSAGSPQALRLGALTRPDGTPTVRWLLNGRLDRFQKLTAWSWLRWMGQKLRTAEGTLHLTDHTRFEPNQLSVIGMADATPPLSVVFSRWSWDVRMRSVSGSLHEVPPSLLTETYRGRYEAEGGVLVPIVEPTDPTTQPVPVPTNPAPRQNTNPAKTKGLAGIKINLNLTAIRLPSP